MTDSLFAEEIRDVALQLFQKENMHELEGWKTLTPIELGVLSWYLGSFYYSPL
jgi:hypothetical protein